MKQFFKTMFASALGFIIAGGLLLIISFAAIGVMVSSLSDIGKQDKITKVKNNTVLHMEFNKPIVDRNEKDPFSDINVGPFQDAGTDALNEIIENLEKAKADTNIKGIFLDLSFVSSGMATLQEVRASLEDFKEEGKWIVAYGENYSQAAYYLATVADEVYLHPQGEMLFKGLNAEVLFYKGFLDKLDIEMQIVRGSNNKFKSAVEPFIYTEMSDANRKQMSLLLNSLWGEIEGTVAEARGISAERLDVVADSLLALNPEGALASGLVDKLVYRDEFKSILKEKLGVEEEDETEMVSYAKYRNAKPAKSEDDKDDKKSWKIKDRVAVIYALGAIQSGEGDGQTIGSETTAKAIRTARQDSNVKAIVMRVNSPGGSALASDVIWREAELAKAEKPFIVSMGDYAASGGYYISAGADKIFANSSTVTGSIGVFGMIPNAKGFVNNKLGVTVDNVKTNENAAFITSSRALTDFEYNKLQESVDKVYDTFLSRVAEGRGMSSEAVDAIGQGRVWSGKDALEIGLVDTLGGLEAAIAYAVAEAGLEEYRLKELPEVEDPFQKFLENFASNAKVNLIEEELGENYIYYQQLKEVQGIKGVQTRMPFFMEMQ